MDGASAVLARQEPHPEHGLHVRLDEVLHIALFLGQMRHYLGHAVFPRVEQLQARHLPLLGSEITNAEWGRIVSTKGFGLVEMA